MVANSNDDTQKKQQKAVALKYDSAHDAAPTLAAKGKGWLAEKIVAIAKEHNIPIHQDADLVAVLEKVELEQEIPLEVYAVVAEIFAYLYRANENAKQKAAAKTP